MQPTGIAIDRQGKYLTVTFENRTQMVKIRTTESEWIKFARQITERADPSGYSAPDSAGRPPDRR
jgi:hypothetical protein